MNLRRLVLFVALAAACPLFAQRFIIELDGQPSALAGKGVAASHAQLFEQLAHDLGSARIRHRYSAVLFGAAVELTPDDVARLRELPYVRAIHPDREVKALADGVPTDAGARVNAVALPTRGAGITVAIIDTGIDYRHADLGGGLGAGFKVAGGYDFVNDDADPDDDQGHGTHVAAIVAANGPALRGVAPEATLYAYKVLSRNGTGAESDVIAGIERAADPNGDGDTRDHHDVINMSLGGHGTADTPMSRAADHAVAAGAIVVIAAGNDGGLATIGAPGAARDAITVGAVDAAGVATSFSSRGPSAKHLGFKPDVMAPGANIESAKMGGGVISYNGTSLAAPHVAGVAALLKKLHPDWTPADMKAALAASTLPVDGSPFTRGVGRVDAVRANAANVFPIETGISFGLVPQTAGTAQLARTLTIVNRSASAQTLNVAPSPAPAGVTVTVAPQTVTIDAGKTATVEVRLTLDHAAMPFTEERIVSGSVAFGGGATFVVPWGLVRSARATLLYDGGWGDAFGTSDRMWAHFRPFGDGAEVFVDPGRVWDFHVAPPVAFGVPSGSPLRLIAIEGRAVNGDEQIAVRADDAPIRIVVDGRDAAGAPLDSIVSVRWLRDDVAGFEFTWRLDGTREIHTSTMSERYTIAVAESAIDLRQREAYSVQHEPLRGVTTSRTLVRDASSYRLATFGWSRSLGLLKVCAADGDIRLSGSSYRDFRCPETAALAPGTLRYYSTDAADPYLVSGIRIESEEFSTPLLRAIGGAMRPMWDATPSAAAPAIETAMLQEGPLFPFAFPGTTGGITPARPRPGFYGSLDDFRGRAAEWTLSDPAGAIVARGAFGTSSGTAPAARAGHRYVVTTRAGGTLEVMFGNNASDLVPPTLTSLRIVDAANRLTDRLAANQPATLRFSAADFDYTAALQTRASRPEATKVWYRISGSTAWVPLTVVREGSETGNANALRHAPSGDLYRVDLASVTANANVRIDLRIEIEDAAGNRIAWTQSPAAVVGNVTESRRRAVR